MTKISSNQDSDSADLESRLGLLASLERLQLKQGWSTEAFLTSDL